MRAQSLRETVAGEVRAELGRQRRSAVWLAREVGFSQPAMSRRLTGELPFTLDLLGQIAEALDVPVASFLGAGEKTTTGRYSVDSLAGLLPHLAA